MTNLRTNILLKEFDVNNNEFNVNYPVRIHNLASCNCARITKAIVNPDGKYFTNVTNLADLNIVEKIWNDPEYNKYPKMITISGDKIDKLFNNQNEKRKKIFSYFENYNWSESDSVEIRNCLDTITTICFCQTINNKLFCNSAISNSGFVIVGTDKQIGKIAKCFNKNFGSTKFNKLDAMSLEKLALLADSEKDYTVNLLLDNEHFPKFISNDTTKHTLVGHKSYNSKEVSTMYSLSFGKRQWFPNNNEESSFICAKRILFDEFNIQFSQKLYLANQSCNQLQIIENPGSILYFLHLTENISINYIAVSNVIYLDC